MGRLLLVFLIVLGAALYFERTRAVVLEWTEPLVDPAYAWMTRQQLGQIASDLDVHLERRGRAPFRRGEFDAWLDDRYPQASSRADAWGTRYRIRRVGPSFQVTSAGPDLEFDTADDLVESTAGDAN